MTYPLLIWGDCLTCMPALSDHSVDLILTDLPFGTSACSWDTIIPFEPLWKQYWRLIKPNGTIVLFGVQPFTSKLVLSCIDKFRYSWVWVKNKGCNFAQAPYMPVKTNEDIVVFSQATIAKNSINKMTYNPQGITAINKLCPGKKAGDHWPGRSPQKPYIQKATGYPTAILKFDKEPKSMHPTQKPVALLEYLIKTHSNEGDTVLDNCMGSGSTGVACINTKRKFIGIEQDNKFYDIANERITLALNNGYNAVPAKTGVCENETEI